MRNHKTTPKKKRANIPLRRKIAMMYVKVVFFSKIILIAFLILFFSTKYFSPIKHHITQNIYELMSDIGFKLENVSIEGQYHSITEDILATLNADKGTPIFALDLESIKTNLKNNRWIKNVVRIERRLPNNLYIKLVERMPIAIWQIDGKVFLIDGEGYKITSDTSNFSNLLQVVGSDANIYASTLIEDLTKHSELASKIKSAVRYGGRRWNLNLEQEITIKMPDSDFEHALNYLTELNSKKLLFDQNYKIIDLRDSNKYYIEKN